MQRATLIAGLGLATATTSITPAWAEESPASAEESPERPTSAASVGRGPTRASIDRASERYFDAEDLCNGVYVGLGASLALGGALAIGTSEDVATSSAGYPLVIVGGIEIAIGVLYLGITPGFREDARVSREKGAAIFLRDQTARMRSIESTFVYYKVATGAVVASGVILSAVGAAIDEDALRGVGFGLATAASAELGMQHVTHGVARDYLEALEGFSVRPVWIPPAFASPERGGYVGLRAVTAF